MEMLFSCLMNELEFGVGYDDSICTVQYMYSMYVCIVARRNSRPRLSFW